MSLIADRHQLSRAGLEIAGEAEAQYPLQGIRAFEFKVVDSASGTLYPVTLDHSGNQLDPEELDAAEQAAYRARYQALDLELVDWLASAEPTQPIDVIVWLNEPPFDGPQRPDPEADASSQDVQELLDQVDAQRSAAVADVAAPLVERLQDLGYPALVDKYAPALYARLAPEEIQNIATLAEVERIYLAPTNYPDLEVARPTIYADIVHSRGITGSGVKAAQIEVGGRVSIANPYLEGTIQDTTYICSSISGHSTAVAGIIRSTHSSRRGISPNVSLRAAGSCSGSASQLQNRSTAAADWGARVLNLSWGANIGLTPGTQDRFYDSMVINRYRTIVKSAGNEADGCGAGNGNITSPGLAYNVITVGNFNDKNTVGWSDDAMHSCSSWRDPTSAHSDREKPELAAPGTNINSTTISGTGPVPGNSGTSYSAPMVTGLATLLIQRNISLASWPEAIKAILMATATHNIEGGSRLSEYDGAGALVATKADDVARRLNGSWGGRSYSCGTATPLDVATMSLTAGIRTRVAIAWDNNPSYSSYASKPSADLDLQVISPSGAVTVSSISFDNTYEIVSFVPATSGNYKVRIRRIRCDYSPSWLGWAWRKG